MIGNSSHGFGNNSHQMPMSEINTTPLVDVMLVLLVIFIITAPLLTHAVKINLPQASSKPMTEKPEVVDIAMDAKGNLFWNDQPLLKAEVNLKLTHAAQQQPQPELHIRADKETRYQLLAEIMASAQSAGLNKIGFVSSPKSD